MELEPRTRSLFERSYRNMVGRPIFDLRARVDLLIVRDNDMIGLEVYTASEGNHHFLATAKISPTRTFFLCEEAK